MAGTPHEVLIEALRAQPALLDAVVKKLTGVHLPRGLKPSDSTVRFVKVAEVRLDLVLRSGRRGWTIVEVQRGMDPTKRRRWTLAASVLFDQTDKLGDVIVITARRAVARWAERVAWVRTRLGTELRLKPVVLYLGADEGKALLDPRHPELGLFAAWAMQHRHGPKARELVGRAFDLAARLPPALRDAQRNAIVSVLGDRMLAFLREVSMNPSKITDRPAVRRLRKFLEAQGRKEGLAEGEAKGKAEGEAKGRQDALLTLFRARGIPASAEDEARIRACKGVTKLDRWIERAATASSVREVLGARSSPPAGRRRATKRGRAASASRA